MAKKLHKLMAKEVLHETYLKTLTERFAFLLFVMLIILTLMQQQSTTKV